MSEVQPLIIRPTAGLTEEQAQNIRVRALRYVLDCHEAKKKAAEMGGPDDVRKDQDAHTANTNYTE